MFNRTKKYHDDPLADAVAFAADYLNEARKENNPEKYMGAVAALQKGVNEFVENLEKMRATHIHSVDTSKFGLN